MDNSPTAVTTERKRTIRNWGAPLAMALMIGAMGVLYGRANAVPAVQVAQPARIAVVDVMTLINGLSELKDRNAEMKPMRDQLRAEQEALEQQVKQLEADLKDNIAPTDTQRRLETMIQLQEARNTLGVRDERVKRTLDLRNAQVIRELYAKATKAIADMAKREGFDLVLLDDRPVPMTDFASTETLRNDVLTKRLLYVNDPIDVTQRVLTVMENDYAQGKASAKP